MPFEITTTFAENGDGGEQLAQEFCAELMERFCKSPEYAELPDESFGAWTLLDYASCHLGLAVSELSARNVREIVFELFPETVSCEAESAPLIVAELRAFFRWLDREFQLPNAGECLRVFDGSAVEDLRRELADPSNYGMAKGFVMQGRALGFNMQTQEGLDAFLAVHQIVRLAELSQRNGAAGPRRLDPPDFWSSPPPASSPNSRKERRKKRKQQRASRKRNR